MSFEDSLTWQRTLGETDQNDTQGAARAVLRDRYLQMRARTEPLAREIALSVPNYTDHSIAHCDALWDICDLVLGDDFPLNPAEAFVLGGSFLVHDLGMGLAAYSRGLEGILQSESWLDLLAGMYPDTYRELQATVLDDVEQDPTWNGITSRDVKRALTSHLREHHAEQAERIMVERWRLTNDQDFFLMEDSELRHWYGSLIGKIARSHWQDVDDLPSIFSQHLGSLPGLSVPTWTVSPLKVACILRVADAAQVDSRRADPMHTPFRMPQHESLDHWKFQERLLYPQLEQGRLIYTSSEAFALQHADSWWLCFDTIRMIDNELRKVDAVFADLGMARLAARAVAGAENPERFARYVATSGWDPIDARPRISNPDSIIRNLGGRALYGDRGITVLRELLANAVDATRLLQSAYGPEEVRPIRVSIETDNEGDLLVIEDFGIGMKADEVVRYLCDFGTSGWTGHSARKLHPGALASGFRSTGQFGIGFYSSFMVADDITVITRPISGGPAETTVLHFKRGLAIRPMLREAERDERRLRSGTKISLRLKDKAQSIDGIIEEGSKKPRQRLLRERVQRLALLADQPIEVRADADSWVSCDLVGDRWLSMPNRELAEKIITDENLVELGDADEPLIAELARRITDILDKSGNVVGRAAISVGLPYRYGRYDYFFRGGATYCGGFEAGRLHDAVGVFVGQPDTAARNSTSVSVSLDSARDWLRNQIQLLSPNDLPINDRVDLAGLAISAELNPGDLPIGFLRSGIFNQTEFRETLSRMDSVTIIEDAYRVTSLADGTIVFSPSAANCLVEMPEGAVVAAWANYWSFLGLKRKVGATDVVIDDELGSGEFLIGDYLDVRNWWRLVRNAPIGYLLRIVCEEWNTSIRVVLENADWRFPSPGLEPWKVMATDGQEVEVAAITLRRTLSSG